MNLGELKTLTRTYINEPDPAVNKFWSDSDVVTAINVGVKKVHSKIKSLSRWHFTTRATFQTSPGVEYYTLPANLKDLKLVSYEDLDGVERGVSRGEGPNMFQWASPLSYWVVGHTIRIFPLLQSATTIRVYYEARITNLVNDEDTPTFEEDYHDVAAKWAAIELRVKNSDDPDDVYAMLKEREQDMVLDLFHRLPEPYTQTVSYLQGMT